MNIYMIVYITFYLIGCIMSYRATRKGFRLRECMYSRLDRNLNLAFSLFSWVTFLLAHIEFKEEFKKDDKEAKW